MSKLMTRRQLLRSAGLLAGSVGLLTACQPKVVEKVIEVTKEVEKIIRETVMVTEEKEITKIIEKEKIIKETVVVEQQPQAAELTAKLRWGTFRGQETSWKWNEERLLSFREKFPSVEIEFRPMPGGQQEVYGKYMALVAADDLDDIVSLDPGLYHFRRAIEAGILMPLDDLMSTDNLDLTEWFDVFIQMQKYKGHIWGLPSWGWAGYDCLVTNALHFKEAGIELSDPDVPGPSMDMIGEWARKLYKENDRYGLQLAYMDHGLEVVTRSFGGDVLSEDGTKIILLDNEKATQGMRWIYDLAVKDKVIPQGEDLKPAGQSALVAGKLTMYQCGSLCTVNAAKAVTDKTICEVTQFLYPAQPDGHYTNAVRCGSWNVKQGTSSPQAAYEFVKHIAGREGTIGFNLFGGQGALTRSDAFPALEGANPMYAWFKKPLANGMVIREPANSRGQEYTDALAQYTAKMMDKYNPIPFEQGLQELVSAVQKILDKPME